MPRFVAVVDASAGGATYSPAFVVNHWSTPCNIAVGVEVAGSAQYTVQHTFADPYLVNLNSVSAAAWLNNASLVATAANGDTNYAFPPSGIRLVLASAASARATMTIVQAGPG